MAISKTCMRRKQKPPELPEVGFFQSEKIISSKNRLKSYIGKITKTIIRITHLIGKQENFSNIEGYKGSLENYIKNTRKFTSKITRSEQNGTIIQKKPDICKEQQFPNNFKIIQIRNAISAHIENKNISPLNSDKKEQLINNFIWKHFEC